MNTRVSLQARVEQYLAERRLLGFKLNNMAQRLASFARYVTNAGHQVEKKVKEQTEYQVVVRMDNGKTRQIKFNEKPGFYSGDRVRIDNGVLKRIGS